MGISVQVFLYQSYSNVKSPSVKLTQTYLLPPGVESPGQKSKDLTLTFREQSLRAPEGSMDKELVVQA